MFASLAGLRPLLLLIATGAMLGLSTNLAKIAPLVGLSPLPFLAWSVGGAACILLTISLARGHAPALTLRTTEYFFVAALLSLAAPNLIFFAAIPEIGASFVALAIALPPALTYVGALFLRLETFVVRRALGVALALAGAGWIALLKLDAPAAKAGWILVTLIGPVFLAAGNLYRTLRWPPGERPDSLAPGMLGAAVLILIVFAALGGGTISVPWSSGAILLIASQAAVFAVQYLLFFVLQKLGGPVYLSLLGSVAALIAVPLAVFALGEAPPRGVLVGGLLIGGGIWLLSRKPRR